MSADTESWRPVYGLEGVYEVSDAARVRRVSPARGTRPGYVLTPRIDPRGYRSVKIAGKTRWLHRIVAEAFLGPSDLPMVRHLDGNPTNNRPDNLAWGTSLDNAEDRRRHGRSNLRGAQPLPTHCKRGHEYTSENTRWRRNRGCSTLSRECRQCHRERLRAARAG